MEMKENHKKHSTVRVPPVHCLSFLNQRFRLASELLYAKTADFFEKSAVFYGKLIRNRYDMEML